MQEVAPHRVAAPLSGGIPHKMTVAPALEDAVSDATLMARFAAGDQVAARMLTARLLPGVLALARRLLGDQAEAEDVAQEAMLRLWKIAPDWQADRAKPSTWLYRVATNLCTDRLRRRRGTGLDEIDEPADETPSVQAAMEADDRASALNAAMASLPERQRTALHLRHFEDLSQPEVAEIMETSVEAVESLLSRGKRGLSERLRNQKAALGLN